MSSNSTSASGIMSAAASKTSTKKVTKKSEETATIVVAAPVVATATKAVTKKAATVAATATVTVAPVATASTVAVVAAVAAPVEEIRLDAEAKALTARLLAVRETVSELISEAKRLEKKATRVQKQADKKRRRKAPVEGEEGKPPRISIFQVPTPISPALCAFMSRPSGSLESRSNVTKFITGYVKEFNLKDKHDIKADAKLLKLLGLKAEDKLTYFNLQKYLNVHYIKTEKQLAAAAAIAAAKA